MVTLDDPTAVTVPLCDNAAVPGAGSVPDDPVPELGSVPEDADAGLVLDELAPEDPLVDVDPDGEVVVVAAPALMAVDATPPTSPPRPSRPRAVAMPFGTRRPRPAAVSLNSCIGLSPFLESSPNLGMASVGQPPWVDCSAT
jgi:hypothetical protein